MNIQKMRCINSKCHKPASKKNIFTGEQKEQLFCEKCAQLSLGEKTKIYFQYVNNGHKKVINSRGYIK